MQKIQKPRNCREIRISFTIKKGNSKGMLIWDSLKSRRKIAPTNFLKWRGKILVKISMLNIMMDL